jgi:hypothetical protein
MKAVEFFQKGLKSDTVLLADPKTGLFRYLSAPGPAASADMRDYSEFK